MLQPPLKTSQDSGHWAGQGWHCVCPHPKSYCWGGGEGHRHLSLGLKGLGCYRGHGHQQPHSSLPSCGWVLSTAQLPVQGQHLQVCREKWRLSVAGAAAARAEGSAWPSRYWMERSWKQGSASSTAVARSVLPRDTHTSDCRHPTLCSHTSIPSWCHPSPGNMLKCSQNAAQRAAVLLLCHPDSEAPRIDAVL